MLCFQRPFVRVQVVSEWVEIFDVQKVKGFDSTKKYLTQYSNYLLGIVEIENFKLVLAIDITLNCLSNIADV